MPKKSPRLRSPVSTECLTPLVVARFSPCSTVFGVYSVSNIPGYYPLTAFCASNGLYERGAAGAPAWFLSVLRVARASLENILMYLDVISWDNFLLHYVATLVPFFER